MKELRSLVAIFYLVPALALVAGFPVSVAAQEHTTTHQETTHSTGSGGPCGLNSSRPCGLKCTGIPPMVPMPVIFMQMYTRPNMTLHLLHSITLRMPTYIVSDLSTSHFPVFYMQKVMDGMSFSSSKFNFDFFGHGEGRKAYNQYVLDAGAVKRVQDASFPIR